MLLYVPPEIIAKDLMVVAQRYLDERASPIEVFAGLLLTVVSFIDSTPCEVKQPIEISLLCAVANTLIDEARTHAADKRSQN